MSPYDGYKVYGPYLSKKEQRRFVVLIRADGYRTGTSYARYLMSLHLDRILGDDEVVDHRDDNSLNDVIENYQILSWSENNQKNRSKTLVTLVCPMCGIEFTREKRNTHLSKPGNKPTTCSRTCGGKQSHLRDH